MLDGPESTGPELLNERALERLLKMELILACELTAGNPEETTDGNPELADGSPTELTDGNPAEDPCELKEESPGARLVGKFSKLDPRITRVEEEDTGDSVDPRRLLEPRETREVLGRPTVGRLEELGVLSPIPKEADTPKEAEIPTAKEGLVEPLGRAMMDV